MKKIAIALAAVIAISGTAFAGGTDKGSDVKNIKSQSVETIDAPTYQGKRFIDPTSTGSIRSQDDQGKRLGGNIDPSVLSNLR